MFIQHKKRTVATSSSLLTLKDQTIPTGQPYHMTIPCFIWLYGVKVVAYFRIFKLWFTLRVSASAVAPVSLIVFHSRLWE